MKAGPPSQRPLYYHYYYCCSPVAFKSHSYASRVIFAFLRRKNKKKTITRWFILLCESGAREGGKKNRMEKSKVPNTASDNGQCPVRGSLLTLELWIKKSRTRTRYFHRSESNFLFAPAFLRVRKICLKCIFCENS